MRITCSHRLADRELMMSKFIEIKHLKENDKAIEKITNKIIEGSDNNFVEVYEGKTDD